MYHWECSKDWRGSCWSWEIFSSLCSVQLSHQWYFFFRPLCFSAKHKNIPPICIHTGELQGNTMNLLTEDWCVLPLCEIFKGLLSFCPAFYYVLVANLFSRGAHLQIYNERQAKWDFMALAGYQMRANILQQERWTTKSLSCNFGFSFCSKTIVQITNSCLHHND